ncbi:MAG TPA: F0F1 ATP synthase subunit A [Thermoanaerobaculia bacterium]|nr:F0F1 ATP synthase subunit A [Thermoanaerobaculia bacterium]
MRLGSIFLALMLFLAAPLRAQDSTRSTYGPAGDHLKQESSKNVDIITPHITDSHYLELPFVGEYELPRWKPFHAGGIELDMSPTKHVVFLLLAAALCIGIMIPAATSNQRQTAHEGHAKGFAGAIESIVLYIRNEVILPNVGHHGNGYVPFGLTLFFFILFANLLGLIPYGSTATGNISVTATLALITFVVVEVAGMKAQGAAYIKTIIYWPSDQPIAMKLPMTLIMTPVEIIGKFTKPFALAIRLFANMTAGHVVLLALISLIFTFGSWFIAPAPVVMGVAISMLEIFVAFLQAFIFTLLASVFIGLIREGAH